MFWGKSPLSSSSSSAQNSSESKREIDDDEAAHSQLQRNGGGGVSKDRRKSSSGISSANMKVNGGSSNDVSNISTRRDSSSGTSTSTTSSGGIGGGILKSPPPTVNINGGVRRGSTINTYIPRDEEDMQSLIRTLQMDLEEEQGRRREMEITLTRLQASSTVLRAMNVDELTQLESTLEENLKNVRSQKERKMKEALGDEQSRLLCVICLTKPKTSLFLPCKHLCCCTECAGRIMRPGADPKTGQRPTPQCPICRIEPSQVLDVYA